MGTIITEIDDLDDVAIHTFLGRVTANEIAGKIESYFSGAVNINVLWDFSEARMDEITSDNIRDFVEMAKRYAPVRKGGKTAMVFSTDLGFGLGRMFNAFQDIVKSPVSYKSFRNKSAALEWLKEKESAVG
jgi:hypothetical protein